MNHLYKLTLLFCAITMTLMAQTQDNFGELIYEVDLGSQTPTPDRSIVGIQVVDDYLFVTGFDPDDYWQHKLYKFNADGTELIDVYSYGIEAAGWKDMAYDGEYLYVTDMDTIRQLEPSDGQKTGVTIPAPFYYNRGLAYNPLNDHFYVSGEGGYNIYEIDRDGNIVDAIGGTVGNYYVGLAVDTVSTGGPFLWTYMNEEEGYNLILKAKQISLQTNQFTGVEFEGASISNIIQETAGGATISYDFVADSVTFIGINLRNGNANDQMEYAMFYNITSTEIPGPQISVFPDNIQNTLLPGDSLDIEVQVYNNGGATLIWSAYIETPDQDTIDNLGDLLFSFSATEQSQNMDRGMNGITFLNDKIWVNGRNFPNQQSIIYEFDKSSGQLLATHPYNTINSVGFRTLATDGEYLYGEDTYTIIQIDPDDFSAVGYILKPSGTFSGLTYDQQTDHFWGGNGNGMITEFDRDGNEINVFLTGMDIQGLAWDQWSPGGPYLWAWVETEDPDGSLCEAIPLNPHTCTPAGEGFTGFAFSNDTSFQDLPGGAVITNSFADNKVTLIALQDASVINGPDTLDNHDFVAVYDMDVLPPPGWMELMNPSYGLTQAEDSSQFTVRLRAIMEDTLMTAVIRISNNDILQPEIIIPVNFEMAAAIFTSASVRRLDNSQTLGQNFPNPMNNFTTVPVTISKDHILTLNLYDVSGNLVKTIINGFFKAGSYNFSVPTFDLSPGVYIYSLITSEEVISRKMTVKR